MSLQTDRIFVSVRRVTVRARELGTWRVGVDSFANESFSLKWERIALATKPSPLLSGGQDGICCLLDSRATEIQSRLEVSTPACGRNFHFQGDFLRCRGHSGILFYRSASLRSCWPVSFTSVGADSAL